MTQPTSDSGRELKPEMQLEGPSPRIMQLSPWRHQPSCKHPASHQSTFHPLFTPLNMPDSSLFNHPQQGKLQTRSQRRGQSHSLVSEHLRARERKGHKAGSECAKRHWSIPHHPSVPQTSPSVFSPKVSPWMFRIQGLEGTILTSWQSQRPVLWWRWSWESTASLGSSLGTSKCSGKTRPLNWRFVF